MPQQFNTEHVRVLLLIVCPLLLLLGAILVDINFRRSVIVDDEGSTFRPSLAVRCAWIFVMVALLGGALFPAGNRPLEIVGYLFAVFELMRTFPQSVTIVSNEIEWGTLLARCDCRGKKSTAWSKRDLSR